MIDPRISLQVKVASIAPAINIFENALMNAQTRDIRGQQQAQRALLNPLQVQQQQQNVDINQQTLDANQLAQKQQVENRILRSVAEFGTKLKPVIQSGNIDQAQNMLTNRLLELQKQNLPTNETVDAITALRSGDSQGVISAIDSIQTIAQQRGLTGTSLVSVKQREFNSHVAAVKADPTFKTVEGKAAANALGITSRAVSNKIVDVGGVPHIYDETQQALIPVKVGGADVTAETVGHSKAKIKQAEKFGELTASSRAKAIDKGFDQITKIDVGLANIDDAIQAVTDGAGTGFIAKNFPSIRAASVLLDNIQGRMALDVIGAVTFGALSKGELDLAKMIALPTGLKGPELIKHLQDKKSAQQKLRNYYGEQIEFLDQGGSVAGFIRSKKRELSNATPPEPANQTTTSGFKILSIK